MTTEELERMASQLSGKFKHYCYGGWDGLPVDETCGMESVLCECDHSDIATPEEVAQLKKLIREQDEAETRAYWAEVDHGRWRPSDAQ